MFYSHEILTSRKYGVATVWLVATLGAKSTLKKVTRKAILDVDVAKACDTIVAPEAPMALRLQSNLLYGVARVYAQQCGYVLTDAEAARNHLRAMSRVIKQAELGPAGANKARADELMLQDDPNFAPDLDLVVADLEMLNNNFMEETQLFSQSPGGSRSLTNASEHSIGGLMIPTSNNSFGGGPVRGLDVFNVRGDSGPGSVRIPARLLDDDDLGLDLGMPVVSSGPVRQPRGLAARVDRTDPASECALLQSERPDQPMLGQGEGFMPTDNDFQFAGDYAHNSMQEPPDQTQHETTSETATASNMKQASKVAKRAVPVDVNTSMGNRMLNEQSHTYLERMRDECHKQQQRKLGVIAKRNAEFWVLGTGTILAQGMLGPLDMFSGAALFDAFAGTAFTGGVKRSHDEAGGSDDGQAKRLRMTRSDEIGRALEMPTGDDFLMIGDGTIERGREAPTPLDDRQLSSLLPWNQSQGSRRPTDVKQPTSASFGGGPLLNITSRRGSRLTTASPLVGRGTVRDELDDFQLAPGSDIQMSGLNDEDEFELYGVAAQVDTQTAAQSQWQKTALTGESANFLDFVQTAIDENDDLDQLDSIKFEKLLPPKDNSRIVAAQAFLHVLTLGSKGALRVEQEEPFGPLVLAVHADAA